ncbi:TolC family protein [Dyadobacter frigoris]|uniref:TolC family protein n=1 Tax=Dyadobacter frigoris TaxID=2576211 RepID=A0A4U6D124_9BACT|nr:TolC family protein [Dyadobacter frigoris]TKT90286.1 TolC family protein [Dyadobacter frigoris]GLU52521.1 cation transporter [Dyadobacter frigoris]
MKHTLLLLGLNLISILPCRGQDTLRLTLEQAQERFVQKNFALIAQKFNVNIAEAGVEQAKLWYNPNLFVETNLYNGYTHKFLPYGKQEDLINPTGGVINLQLQQVLSLTGSRSKLVKLAQSNVALQQSAFQDVMRNARYTLSRTFGNLVNEQAKLRMLNEERTRLENLLEAFRAQLKLGVIAPYEVTRLELEQKNFERDLAGLNVRISQDESIMRVLLSESGTVYIVPTSSATTNTTPALIQLLDLAYANRPDLQAAQLQIQYNQNNLTYQRSLATPNLTIGADYQRVGSAFPHYVGVQALIDLPVRNKNQGNIQSAKVGIDQSKTTSDLAHLQVEQDVVAASQQYQQALIQQQRISQAYLQSIEEISKNATEDYAKRIIDLVSFIDKIRAYRDAQVNLIDLQNDLFQAQQLLNFVTNTKTF